MYFFVKCKDKPDLVHICQLGKSKTVIYNYNQSKESFQLFPNTTKIHQFWNDRLYTIRKSINATIILKLFNKCKLSQQNYDTVFSGSGPTPNFEAIFSCDAAASLRENKWTISISDLAKAIALLNKSIAKTRLPLKKKKTVKIRTIQLNIKSEGKKVFH